MEEQIAVMVIKTSNDGIDGINECEPLNNKNMGMEKALHSNLETQLNSYTISTISPPINAPIFEEVNIGAETLTPNSVTTAKLFDIQIREIDEALMKYGNNSELRQTPTATINEEIHFQTQQAVSVENQGAQQSGTRATQGKKIISTTTNTSNRNSLRNRGRSILNVCSKAIGNLRLEKKKSVGSEVGMFIWSYQANTGGFQKIRAILFIQWWRLIISSANHNEFLNLELSWAGEPMYRL